jgi:hypothetical protein
MKVVAAIKTFAQVPIVVRISVVRKIAGDAAILISVPVGLGTYLQRHAYGVIQAVVLLVKVAVEQIVQVDQIN